MADYQTHCIQCGKLYSAKRKSSKYCGDKCRQNYHRNRVENGVDVPTELTKALDSLRRLENASGEMLTRHAWYLEKVRNAVKHLDEIAEEHVKSIFGEP